MREAGEPVTLSASALESLLTCPARWFLEKEAGGAVPSTSDPRGSVLPAKRHDPAAAQAGSGRR